MHSLFVSSVKRVLALAVGILCLTLMGLGVKPVFAAENIPLDPDFQSIYRTIYNNPSEALEALKRMPVPAANNPARAAQYFFLKAEAEDYLSETETAAKSLDRAKRMVDEKSQPWLYNHILLTEASILEASDQPHKALQVANTALALAENRHDKRTINNALVVRGLIYNTLLDYVAALKDFQRAYEISQEAGSEDMDPGEIAGFIALVYEYRREPELAIPYFQEYADYYRKKRNDMELSIALYGLAKAYKNTGNSELAVNLLNESIEKARKVKDEQGVAYALTELAHIAAAKKDYLRAKGYYRQALALFKKAGNPFKLYDVTSSLALVAMNEGSLDEAQKLLEKAATYLDEKNAPIQFNNLKFMRADLLARRGQYAEAYELLKEAARERQRFISKKSTEQLHRLQVQFQLRDKERENELLQQKARAAEQRNQMQNIRLASSMAVGGILLAWGLRSRQQRRRMEYLATTDSLTGLPNRRVIMDKARQCKHSAAHQPVALALLDFDDFKAINDTYGHAIGDDVLCEFGHMARQALASIGKPGCLGRVGGEEFLLVLPGVSLQEAKQFLENLAAEASAIPRRINQPQITLTLSIGLSLMQDGNSLEEDYAHIDRALYRAKDTGKNRIETLGRL